MKALRFNAPREKGVASLIFVLLVSLAITAASTSVIQTIRKNQHISTAVNATTHSETGVWAAAEAFRIFLESINELSLQALSGDMDIVMDAAFGEMVVENIVVGPPIEPHLYRVSARIVNRHPVARSTSTLQVVYEVDSAGGGVEAATTSVNFNDSLNVNGGIELTNNGNPIDLNVVGDVTLGGVSVNPINQINATGNVVLNSKVTVNAVYAGGDIELNNSIVQVVEALGDLVVTGDGTVQEIYANGDVTIQSSGRFEEVRSRKKILVKGGGSQGILNAGETVVIQNSNGVDSVESIGDVDINAGGATITSVVTEGDISCPGVWWKKTSFLSAEGTLHSCPPNGAAAAGGGGATITVESGVDNTVGIIDELQPKPLAVATIDVWTLKDSANYFVWHDSATNRIKVEVNSVAGFTDGTVLTLGKYNGSPPYLDYLCETVNGSGICTSPSTPTMPLCFGYSPWNAGCITYNTGTDTFSIAPNTTVPGVILFDGSVELANGHGISTILAAGNIKTSGSYKQWAANFGSFDKVCLANADHAASSVQARYTLAYSTHYPTNLCDIPAVDYTPNQAGNIALAAGGINPDPSINPTGAYSGGDITLGSSSDIVGAVLAGNELSTGGSTTIQGAVTAGAHGDIGSGNSLGGSTTIDFSSTEDFDTTDIPDFGGGGPPTVTLIPTAKFVWARTL